MTPRGFLGFVAGIRGFDGAERRKRVAAAMAGTQLEDVALQPIDTLSKGFKRRVGLAQALLHDPPVLIWTNRPMASIPIRSLKCAS